MVKCHHSSFKGTKPSDTIKFCNNILLAFVDYWSFHLQCNRHHSGFVRIQKNKFQNLTFPRAWILTVLSLGQEMGEKKSNLDPISSSFPSKSMMVKSTVDPREWDDLVAYDSWKFIRVSLISVSIGLVWRSHIRHPLYTLRSFKKSEFSTFAMYPFLNKSIFAISG